MNVGSILQGAFALFKDRPGAVAVWGLIYLAADVLMALGTSALVGPDAYVTGRGSPGAIWSALGNLLVLNLALLVVVMVLYTAIQRAVLWPGERGFASLQLGMDEVRAFLLAVFYLVIFYVGIIFVGVVMALFVGVSLSTGSPGTVWFMIVIQFLALVCFLTWLYVKLSLSFPLTLLRGRFVIGEAWALSRGKFWTLFGTYFVLFVIMFVVSLVVGLVTQQEYFSAIMRGGFNSESAQQAAYRQYGRLASGGIDAMMMLNWVLSAALGTIGLTLWGGATATAARELSGDVEGLADTFS
ncbi:MAG TPA: hypothetical protein VGO55_14420 [Allosphingosinicella sp.]|jgi:hypothetical protein|nr:hypothetical protein [Allosphingosinicella sp.]